jgi:hypothetical protein
VFAVVGSVSCYRRMDGVRHKGDRSLVTCSSILHRSVHTCNLTFVVTFLQ